MLIFESVKMRAVSGGKRGFSAHPSCAEHKCGWKAENHVRSHLHQRYRSPLRQPRLQEGRCRHEQEVLDLIFVVVVVVVVSNLI